jgi:hypothetical protein
MFLDAYAPVYDILYIAKSYAIYNMVEGSLEVKLPTIWTIRKAEVGSVREEKRRREKIREEKK